jgi:hypothetical protein
LVRASRGYDVAVPIFVYIHTFVFTDSSRVSTSLVVVRQTYDSPLAPDSPREFQQAIGSSLIVQLLFDVGDSAGGGGLTRQHQVMSQCA